MRSGFRNSLQPILPCSVWVISSSAKKSASNRAPDGSIFYYRIRRPNAGYEVELQLGGTDEAHIIRTIEYWDIERKRYPQYDHCAVIVAEDITSRFLNVLALFNGAIPLIAIQMQALKVGEAITLVFTKVTDELSRGLVDEDEDAEAAPTDRAYWEKRGSKRTVQLADQLLTVAREFEPSVELKYNKFYIGLSKEGQPFNFVAFRPKKARLNIEIKIPRDASVDRMMRRAG
jgi:hypothetical protein